MKRLSSFLPPAAVCAVSCITHFIHFGNPQAVVFDEVYTGGFLNDYWHGAYFFDVHPPLGKLLIKFFADTVGATHAVDWSAIGNPVPHWVILARILPMLAGALLPLVIYCLCRVLKMSVFVSFFAGLTVCFENSLIVQSRFLLTDSMLVLFGFSSLLFYCLYRETRVTRVKNDMGEASETRDISKNWRPRLFLFLSAIAAAAAASIKWTGLAFIAIIGIFEIIEACSGKIRRFVLHAMLYGGILLAVYLGAFAVHFSYLTSSGPGDDFMTPRFQKTLTGSAYADDPAIQPRGFFGKFIELNLEMYAANETMTVPHPYSSKWYTWPLMLRPIFYWQSEAPSTGSYIYLLGNPLVYWSGTLAIMIVLGYAAYALRKKTRKQSPALTCIVVGYLVNFIPFIFIGRVMFLYHYEAALVFSIMAAAFLLDKIGPTKRKIAVGTVFLVLFFMSFVFFSPLTYGLPLSTHELSMRMWLASWR